ncbi:uncharacterized protein EI97DRAFT_425102 [Westerdykella ornata]|uniref:Spindle pole body component n=1 Tax=Westerdykella ornata TaxID=318751 RepID=A0A6A6J8S6_WESOR|nr:uncharacterized protein EI97DRAFT_425102 [Westerdykella ornata]KAF2272970.1 hypothetical protein EI97DRAFT_425102 [Westerdykella ornata]
MLHEILLSLSGHPSALFEGKKDASHVTSGPLSLLSPPEAELLSSLGHLSRLHRQTRELAVRIAGSHPSTVCRAVATAISSHHLQKFQQKVLAVENRILRRDASIVGAYNIVPLAGIVSEFSEWTKLMEWLWDISNFMIRPGGDGEDDKKASGAELIDKLRTEAQTGYPDIESAAVHLGTVAETSWLRQLATWLLYGRLPSFGASDFFIVADDGEDVAFSINHTLLPKFVTRSTASSILFIGRSLNQIRSLPSASRDLSSPSSRSFDLELLPTHIEYLSKVSAPIASARLSEAVSNIRLSLSRNLLQYLLPQEKIVELLTVLHHFFLLGRGEFAMALINEADGKIQSRHKAPLGISGHGIRGILLKEAEISNTLSRAWTVLASLSGEDDNTDDVLDLAADIVHLTVHSSSSSGHRPGTPGRAKESNALLPAITDVVFADLLLSVPTKLTMDIPSPLDLFMTKSDLDIYSAINAYLVAIRRAHLHLLQLWRHGGLRREPIAPPITRPGQKAAVIRRRQKYEKRNREMRKIWATCAAAIFLLSESEAYFQGEVINESFKHFRHWVTGPQEAVADSATTRPSSSHTTEPNEKSAGRKQHDPEALSLAHRQFLNSISHHLLLTDTPFAKHLRQFLTHVDELVALIVRLQSVRQNLDLEEDDGVEDFMANYKQEEKDVAKEMDRARRRLDSDMKSLLARLRDLDAERVGSVPGIGGVGKGWEEGMYEPLRVGGIDTLLMKLDWGSVEEEEQDGDLLGL